MAEDGDEALRAFVARLRNLGDTFTQATAKEAAPLVQEAAKATAAAGTDPYGQPWKPRKDGARALPNAADAVTAAAKDTVVQIKVTGPYAIHSRMSGESRRQVIPDADRPLPKSIVAALHEGARRAWSKVMGA